MLSSMSIADIARLRTLLKNVWATKNLISWLRLIDTQSMSPSLAGNVFVLVEWGSTINFEPGDLMLFHDDHLKLPVLHRICLVHTHDSRVVRVLQIADQFISIDQIGGSWVPVESVLGRITAVKYGEQETKITQLSQPVIRYLGRLIAYISVLRMEQADQIRLYRARIDYNIFAKKVAFWMIFMLHKFLCYNYALLLRLLSAEVKFQQPSKK